MAKFKVNIKVTPDLPQLGVTLRDGSNNAVILSKATQPNGEDKILEEGDYAVWTFAQPVAPGTSATTTISREGSTSIVGTVVERDGLLAGQTEFRLQNGKLS